MADIQDLQQMINERVKVLLEPLMTDIANAIRSVGGTSDDIIPTAYTTHIRSFVSSEGGESTENAIDGVTATDDYITIDFTKTIQDKATLYSTFNLVTLTYTDGSNVEITPNNANTKIVHNGTNLELTLTNALGTTNIIGSSPEMLIDGVALDYSKISTEYTLFGKTGTFEGFVPTGTKSITISSTTLGIDVKDYATIDVVVEIEEVEKVVGIPLGVNPSTETQVITPSEGYMYNEVTINPVTYQTLGFGTADELANVVADGNSILGIQGKFKGTFSAIDGITYDSEVYINLNELPKKTADSFPVPVVFKGEGNGTADTNNIIINTDATNIVMQNKSPSLRLKGMQGSNVVFESLGTNQTLSLLDDEGNNVFLAENIKYGKTMGGITGTFPPESAVLKYTMTEGTASGVDVRDYAYIDITATNTTTPSTIPNVSLDDDYKTYLSVGKYEEVQGDGSIISRAYTIIPTYELQVNLPKQGYYFLLTDTLNTIQVVKDEIESEVNKFQALNLHDYNIKNDVTLLGLTGTYKGNVAIEVDSATKMEDNKLDLTYETDKGAFFKYTGENTDKYFTNQYYVLIDTDVTKEYKPIDIGNQMLAGLLSDTLYRLEVPKETTKLKASVLKDNTTIHSVDFEDYMNCLCSEIGNNAFDGCTNLSIGTPLPYNLISIGDNAFGGCSVNMLTISIPSKVTYVGSSAFANCTNLESADLSLATGLTTINSYCFYKCSSLSELTLPDSITEILFGAFANCTSLTRFDMPPSLTTIGAEAFANCTGLKEEMVIPANVTSIGGSAFRGTNIDTFVFSNLNCEFGQSVFQTNEVTTIKYSGSLESWLKKDWSSVNLTHPTGGITSNMVDLYCNNIKVTTIDTDTIYLPNISVIYNMAFKNVGSVLVVDTRDSNVTSINTEAFYGCDNINHIYIGEQVTHIGDRAFYFQTSEELIIEFESATPPTEIGELPFGNDPLYKTFRVPRGSLEAYKTALPNYTYAYWVEV